MTDQHGDRYKVMNDMADLLHRDGMLGITSRHPRMCALHDSCSRHCRCCSPQSSPVPCMLAYVAECNKPQHCRLLRPLTTPAAMNPSKGHTFRVTLEIVEPQTSHTKS
jgi:hypothetical protein